MSLHLIEVPVCFCFVWHLDNNMNIIRKHFSSGICVYIVKNPALLHVSWERNDGIVVMLSCTSGMTLIHNFQFAVTVLLTCKLIHLYLLSLTVLWTVPSASRRSRYLPWSAAVHCDIGIKWATTLTVSFNCSLFLAVYLCGRWECVFVCVRSLICICTVDWCWYVFYCVWFIFYVLFIAIVYALSAFMSVSFACVVRKCLLVCI